MNFNIEGEIKVWACHKSCSNTGTIKFQIVTDYYKVFK